MSTENTTKTCTKCKQIKNKADFHKKKSTKDGLAFRCKECTKEDKKDYYKANVYKIKNYHEKRKIHRKEIRRKQNKKRQKEILEFKKQFCCFVCGESDPAVIDFHHLNPKLKGFGVGTLLQRAHTKDNLAIIWKEIQKCLPLCANCHRKLHVYGELWYADRQVLRLNEQEQ